MRLEVTIESVIPDNTAFTALVALRGLGCDWLHSIERADGLWLTLDDDVVGPASLVPVVEQIARAEVIFNPNKHRLYFDEGPSRPTSAGLAGPTTSDGLELIVTDREDNTDGLVRLLRDTFGLAEVRSAARFVVWRLGADATLAQLEEAAAKLLVNANAQDAHVAPRPARTAWAPAARPETVA